jgi:hypothetical protein
MRSAFSTLINSAITIIVIFFIISQFKKSEPKISEIDFTNIPREYWSQRLQNLVFSVPIENLANYDYTYPQNEIEQEGALGDRFISYPPINSRFLAVNEIYSGSLSVAGSRLLDDSFNFYEEDLQELREYYYSYMLPVSGKAHRFRFTHLELLNFQQRKPFQSLSLSYTYQEDLVRNALATQFKLAYFLLKGTGSDYQTVSLTPGALPERLQAQGVLGRRKAIEQVARNIIQAMRQLKENYPDARIRILLENTFPTDNRFNSNQLLCVQLSECIAIREEIIRQNRFSGSPIDDPEKQVGLIVNTAAVFAAWQDKNSNTYKNNAKTPLALFQLIEALKKEFSGVNQSVHGLKVSYAQQGEKPGRDFFYLSRPFSRALRAQDAFLQLRLLTFFYNESMFGNRGKENFISGNFTPAKRFSLLHEFFFPVADSLNLYYDKDGANEWEQSYSLDLIKHFLTKNALEE